MGRPERFHPAEQWPAVIAGRQELSIEAGQLYNRRLEADGPAPLLKSDGQMVLSGGTLHNEGGVVQSAGTLVLNGLQVFNRNPFYQSQQMKELVKKGQFSIGNSAEGIQLGKSLGPAARHDH